MAGLEKRVVDDSALFWSTDDNCVLKGAPTLTACAKTSPECVAVTTADGHRNVYEMPSQKELAVFRDATRAVGVAIVGILGAMLALQLERSRELGLLRALGMTPLQLGGNITFQTGTIGALAGIAAIPLGLAMAWVLIDVINRRAFGWQIDVTIAPGYLLAGLGLAIGSAFLGSSRHFFSSASNRVVGLHRQGYIVGFQRRKGVAASTSANVTRLDVLGLGAHKGPPELLVQL